jgi:hypothetical protein
MVVNPDLTCDICGTQTPTVTVGPKRKGYGWVLLVCRDCMDKFMSEFTTPAPSPDLWPEVARAIDTWDMTREQRLMLRALWGLHSRS